MNKSIFLAGTAVAALAIGGIALGLCVGLAFGPTIGTAVAATEPADTYFPELEAKAAAFGRQTGEAKACGIETLEAWNEYSRLIDKELSSDRIAGSQFFKLDDAFFGAAKLAEEAGCRSSGLSAAG